MPIAVLGPTALDCRDPRALAEFYAQVLGGTVKQVHEDWIELTLEGGARLAFQHVPGHVAPQWPGTTGAQQLHLDLEVPRAELDSAQERVLALGATLLDAGDGERGWRVYADPAGHPFCLCAC
ncbi:VOC family protein [Streptomyces polyrhachis]|uniref:VOC family protein n=1 Tax=Streptomyces polyrhachis TaxID=1282885 RepID=A0ABW2GND0_9ACTN